jgi:hypothetical protein
VSALSRRCMQGRLWSETGPGSAVCWWCYLTEIIVRFAEWELQVIAQVLLEQHDRLGYYHSRAEIIRAVLEHVKAAKLKAAQPVRFRR